MTRNHIDILIVLLPIMVVAIAGYIDCSRKPSIDDTPRDE